MKSVLKADKTLLLNQTLTQGHIFRVVIHLKFPDLPDQIILNDVLMQKTL